MKELLFRVTKEDFDIQTFRSGGKGGQNQNKRDTGVRLVHKASGAVGESRSHRSQLQNRSEAFRRLLETTQWRLWFNLRVMEAQGLESIEEAVERQLKQCKVEVRENGRWVTV